ncbi:MAG: tetratricopeptide repeat protein [Bryobacteraceae bacterium]
MKLHAFALLIPLLAVAPARAGDPPEVLVQKAQEAHRAGEMATAIRLYREFLKDHPEVAEIRTNLGAALARDGQFEEAIKEYREALKKLPNPGIRLNLALAYYKLGRLPEAVPEFEAVHKAQPAALQPVYLLGDCWLQMGQSQKVIDLLTPLEQQHPEDNAIAYMLGTALLNLHRTGLAQMVLDRILREGESAETALLLGASEFEAHDNKAALAHFKRAIQLNPNLPSAHGFYARVLKEMGDTDAAAEQYREELKLNPYDYVSNLDTALLLKEEGKLDEALVHVERGLRVRPGDAGALYQVAAIHVLQAKNDQARAELEQMIKDYPDFTEAHVSLATVYYRLKRKEDGDRERGIVRQLQEEDQKRLEESQKQKPAGPGALEAPKP